VKSDVANAKTAVVAHETSNNGELVANLGLLAAADGYTAPITGDSNYASGLLLIPKITPNTSTATPDPGGFCIEATSVTTNSFAASDTSGVVAGTCTTDGVIAPQ
jgi:hypothetical protein